MERPDVRDVDVRNENARREAVMRKMAGAILLFAGSGLVEQGSRCEFNFAVDTTPAAATGQQDQCVILNSKESGAAG